MFIQRVLSSLGVSSDLENSTSSSLPQSVLKQALFKSNSKYFVEFSLAEVSQWISLSMSLSTSILPQLEKALTNKSYLINNKPSVADAALFISILDHQIDISGFPEISRWYSNAQIHFAPPLGASVSPSVRTSPLFPIFKFASPAPTIPTTPSEESNSTQTPKAEKKEKEGKKKEKEQAPSATETPSSEEDALDPSKLEIRIGRVVRCWDHPESEKLLCEEIDLGPDAGGVRTIASGLRAFYKASEVEGRLVCVLANLKERPMAGFKSQGMVLCACNADHTQVVLLEPAEGSGVGDLVTFPGFAGQPAPANQVAKKKILEKLAPELRTDESGVAHWRNSPFTIGTTTCKASLANAVVS